jgi:acetyltransferase-like isoleucine patch superfamily enzyme
MKRSLPATGRIVKSVVNRARPLAMRARGSMARLLLPGRFAGGKSLAIGRNVDLVIYGELILGDDVILSDGCALEVGPRGRLVLRDRVFVGRHSVIAAQESIEIGEGTLVAEHCTIRDQDHQMDPAARLKESEALTGRVAPDRENQALTEPVVLGRTVWVGAGARVLKGARVGEGTVIAANAVVRGEFPARAVVGGVPARVLRTLTGSDD